MLIVDAGGDRPLYSSHIAVIREVYDGEFAPHGFAMQLERALDACCSIIVIEPTHLGDETARWISVGNCLHKTAVLSGLGSVVSVMLWPNNVYLFAPLGIFSTLCTALYTASWQFDNCVKYQVERDPGKIAELQLFSGIGETSPVVLVRKDDTRRKILHCSVSLIATTLCAYRLYHLLK